MICGREDERADWEVSRRRGEGRGGVEEEGKCKCVQSGPSNVDRGTVRDGMGDRVRVNEQRTYGSRRCRNSAILVVSHARL